MGRLIVFLVSIALIIVGCSSEEPETVYQRQTPVVGNPEGPTAPPPESPSVETEVAEEEAPSSGYHPPVVHHETPSDPAPVPTPSQIDKPNEEEVVRNYFASRSGMIRRIYDDRLSEEPELAGRVTIDVTVTNGRVAASLAGNTTGDSALANRIISAIRGWSVVGVDGPVEMRLPFDFQH